MLSLCSVAWCGSSAVEAVQSGRGLRVHCMAAARPTRYIVWRGLLHRGTTQLLLDPHDVLDELHEPERAGRVSTCHACQRRIVPALPCSTTLRTRTFHWRAGGQRAPESWSWPPTGRSSSPDSQTASSTARTTHPLCGHGAPGAGTRAGRRKTAWKSCMRAFCPHASFRCLSSQRPARCTCPTASGLERGSGRMAVAHLVRTVHPGLLVRYSPCHAHCATSHCPSAPVHPGPCALLPPRLLWWRQHPFKVDRLYPRLPQLPFLSRSHSTPALPATLAPVFAVSVLRSRRALQRSATVLYASQGRLSRCSCVCDVDCLPSRCQPTVVKLGS